EVVVKQMDRTHAQAARPHQAFNSQRRARASSGDDELNLRSIQTNEGFRVVRDDELVLLFGVFEEVEESRLLHESRNKVQLALSILNDELLRGVGTAGVPLHAVREARFRE